MSSKILNESKEQQKKRIVLSKLSQVHSVLDNCSVVQDYNSINSVNDHTPDNKAKSVIFGTDKNDIENLLKLNP